MCEFTRNETAIGDMPVIPRTLLRARTLLQGGAVVLGGFGWQQAMCAPSATDSTPSETSFYQKMMASAGFAAWVAGTFTDANHANDISKAMVRTPKDYGMAFEEVTFPATDGCQIAAWYIPAKDKTSKKLAIVSHQSW